MIQYPFLLALAAIILAVPPAGAETPKETGPTRKSVPAVEQQAIPISGKVTEILASGGYTYVNLLHDGVKTWVAFPTIPVTIGQNLTLVPGYEMKNFSSKTLNRTFDRVIFSLGPVEKQAIDPNVVKAAHQARDTKEQKPSEPATSKTEAIPAVPPHSSLPKSAVGKVKKASGPNAYTVKQLHAKRSSLDNKQVVVRGKVVKVNTRILKQCWIHIQDGTGTPGKTDSNLVTTTPSTNTRIPAVGDLVTVTGTLHKDRDFGGGYRYFVILENSEYRKDGTK